MDRSHITTSAQNGFTLIEMVIAIVIIGILATVGASMFSDSFTTSRMVAGSQNSASDARLVLERVAREIREVKYVNGTGYSISSTMAPSSTGMVFTRRINGVDAVVTVAKNGNVLTLAHSLPTAVTSALSHQVSAFTLDFRKLDNTAATLATEVRFVVITLTISDAISGQSITEQTRVALRNA